jgi:pimeloyl-ACP methyl ester carboxylesterase
MSFVQAGARQLEYFEFGRGKNLVVLIHGAGSSAVIWHQVQVLMAEEGFHTFAFSLIGAGRSDRSSDTGDYNPASYAKDIRLALDALNISTCAIVGHSLGVSNVLNLASDYADQLNLRAMILMAGGAGNERKALTTNESEKIVSNLPTPDPKTESERRASWEKLHMGLPGDIRDALWRDITNNPRERAIGQAIGARKDMTAFLNQTDIPTLIVSGDKDSVVPLELTLDMYPKLKKQVRHLHVISGIDHFPNAEVPGEISRVYTEFLNNYAQ